jgi:hypothetical protein
MEEHLLQDRQLVKVQDWLPCKAHMERVKEALSAAYQRSYRNSAQEIRQESLLDVE